MPYCRERQQAADALYAAFVTALITEHEESSSSSDSDQSSSGSSSLSNSSSSDSDDHGLRLSELWLAALGDLYSQRYLNKQVSINKSTDCLQLLLHDWRLNRPEIFCTFLWITPQCFEDLVETIQADKVFHNH